ncbi:hypothetical protein AMJ82_07350 [candidate division TA06 bacterium SM23_40]|uniref:Polymerase/histidinol phosphatase N-terminal domain-containing protein n=1 Tax=candidate division TA06 bacterium SM23_40 TaxID=1703774 RepID=A0A0S8G7E6_UNCT6|nr:MAG: hypothetical protein AMJ82_07350 [candidate division TA06 bacterium SM23_40]
MMDERYADLHIHTTYSDGLSSPASVVQRAVDLGLRAIAITDHDSVGAIEPALVAARGTDVEVIPGVELSVTIDDEDVHILGYLIDCRHTGLLELLHRFASARLERARKIVAKLDTLGAPLEIDRVLELAGRGTVGRPHIADALVESGWARTFDDAFLRFIGYHAPAYVGKPRLDPALAFRLLRDAGGLSVLAHPGVEGRERFLPQLKEADLDGIEVWHTQHDRRTVARLSERAREMGLLMTGGSDCHGERRSEPLIGTVKVPYSVVGEMKQRRRDKGLTELGDENR